MVSGVESLVLLSHGGELGETFFFSFNLVQLLCSYFCFWFGGSSHFANDIK